VKQISGDINLISFCSGFCFMVLWVQVPVGGWFLGGFHSGSAVCKLGASVVLLKETEYPTLSPLSARFYKWLWHAERRHLVLI